MSQGIDSFVRRAAKLIAEADALLITAGAGMGVDGGLPDFRGREGFWRAYPPLRSLGLSFEEMAQPRWFFEDPALAWGFYGHRQQLYRATSPHRGYSILQEWGRAMPLGHFVVTSNVDGQFEAAGFEAGRLHELHGNIHALQCTAPCREVTWRDSSLAFDIEPEKMRVRGEMPHCPQCGAMARPNVLMFGDGAWVPARAGPQEAHYRHWLAATRGRRLVIVELGAGVAIPTVRRLGESLVAERSRTTLVRINPDAVGSEDGVIPVRMGALEALTAIEQALDGKLRARPPVVPPPITDVAALPTAKVAARGPGRLPPVKREGEMEILEFLDPSTERPEPQAWARLRPEHADLRNTTFVDLDSGVVEPFNYGGITVAELRTCADGWYDAQQEFAPLPEVGGYVEAGFRFRGGVIRPSADDDRARPGAAVMFICGPDEEPVLSVGVARRPSDGAFVWRYLYEQAKVRPKPLEHPRVPWVARRTENAAQQHAAMLPVLSEVARRLAWMWLNVQAHLEREGEDGEE